MRKDRSKIGGNKIIYLKGKTNKEKSEFVKSMYIRVGIFHIDDVLSHVIFSKDEGHIKNAFRHGIIDRKEYRRLITRKYTVGDFSTRVKMTSLRYRTFKINGLKCATCGIEGKFFALEKIKNQKETDVYHFNLYGYDSEGNEVLITKDHIKPKSNGGKNFQENLQTMCLYCNFEKANM